MIFFASIVIRKNEDPVMPYYVYAIHTDSKLNCFYGSFTDYHEAEICEREKQGFGNSQDNSFVALLYAENQTHAAQRVKQIRRERGLK
jgi:hypothetical protein